MRIRRFIREHIQKLILESKTKDEFFIENGIDPDNLGYLGKGEFGEAYSTGDGRVLKKTSSKTEFEIAKKLQDSGSRVFEAFAKVYKTDVVDGNMYIIMEELEEDSDIEMMYYDLESLLSEQGLPIQYIDHFDFEGVELQDEMKRFISDIEDIVRAYRHLGIEASDIRPENIGYSKDGKLKAFDIDDKSKKNIIYR